MVQEPETEKVISSREPSTLIQIKGIKEGLLILVGEGDWDDLRQALLDQIIQQTDFMRGAKLALDVGNQELRALDLGILRDELSDLGVSLWAVLSTSAITIQTAETLGLATRLPKTRKEIEDKPFDNALHGVEEAVLVSKTMRSGNRLEYPGHVIVIGDVNPGAEIVAGGNVVVWGKLRGMVHAGAQGDELAVVCALDLYPTQLRIADQIAITPKRKGKPQPEVAKLHDGNVVAVPWKQ